MLIRPAVPEDAFEVAALNVRAWQVAYRGLLPDDYLAGLRPEERAARYRFDSPDSADPLTLVAIDNDTIIGFATTGPARDDDMPDGGELLALYVDPASWDRGVGRDLIAAARVRLAEQGSSEAILWVLAGNKRAERFYTIDGWTADGSQRHIDVWGVTVDELRYRRSLP